MEPRVKTRTLTRRFSYLVVSGHAQKNIEVNLDSLALMQT